MKSIALLGATGSIGTSTLSVVEAFPDRFRVVAMAAGRNLDAARERALRHRPRTVSVADPDDAESLARDLPGIRVTSGAEGLLEVACHPQADLVVSALVGSVGLEPTVAAIREGKDVALANKETLVVAGNLVMDEAARHGVDVLPVDSEHNAIHQALRVGPEHAVRRLLLTASGGPFRTWSIDRIRGATVEDALAHPTWDMGAKITVDSATLFNKGLEIIEAHHLFGVPEDRIDVLVHPQSLVHSLVEYGDGTLIALVHDGGGIGLDHHRETDRFSGFNGFGGVCGHPPAGHRNTVGFQNSVNFCCRKVFAAGLSGLGQYGIPFAFIDMIKRRHLPHIPAADSVVTDQGRHGAGRLSG